MPNSTPDFEKKAEPQPVQHPQPRTANALLRLHKELQSSCSRKLQKELDFSDYAAPSLSDEEAELLATATTLNVEPQPLKQKLDHMFHGLAQRCVPSIVGLLRGLNNRFPPCSRMPFRGLKEMPTAGYWQAQFKNGVVYSEVYQHAVQIAELLWFGGCRCCADYERMGLRDERQITKHLDNRRNGCQTGHVLSGWSESETLDAFLFRALLNCGLTAPPANLWTLATWAWQRHKRANDLATGMLLHRVGSAGDGKYRLTVVPYAACSRCGNRGVTSQNRCGCKALPMTHVVRSIVVDGSLTDSGKLRRCPQCCADDCPVCFPNPDSSLREKTPKHKRRLFFGETCLVCGLSLDPRVTTVWQAVESARSHSGVTKHKCDIDDDWERQAFEEGFHNGPHQPLQDAWNRPEAQDDDRESDCKHEGQEEFDQLVMDTNRSRVPGLRLALDKFEYFVEALTLKQQAEWSPIFESMFELLHAKLDLLIPLDDSEPESNHDERHNRYQQASAVLRQAIGKKRDIRDRLAEYLLSCHREAETPS